jgi:hypothetical protein
MFRHTLINNALVAFSDFEEMQSYLKRQWANMLHQFLTTENEAKRVGDILQAIAQSSEKVEFIARQLVAATGDKIAKIKVSLYDYLLKQPLVHDLVAWRVDPSPAKFLENETPDDLCDNQIKVHLDDPEDEDYGRGSHILIHGGPPYEASKDRIELNRKSFLTIRGELQKRLKDASVSQDEFLRDR